jgi:hypothetical protein
MVFWGQQRPRKWGDRGWGIAGASPFRLQVRFKGIGYGGIDQMSAPAEMKRFAAGDRKVPPQYR